MLPQPTYTTTKEAVNSDILTQIKAENVKIYASCGLIVELTYSKLREAFMESGSRYVIAQIQRETATGKIVAITFMRD